MLSRSTILVCALAGGCSYSPGTAAGDANGNGVADSDSRTRTDGGDCVFSAWSPPQAIASLGSQGLDARPRLSPDELSVIFYSDRLGDRDLFTATRGGLNEPFSMPEIVPVVNTTASDRDPALTPDGLQLFFATDRAGTLDIYTASRLSTSANFAAPQSIAALNTANHDYFLSLSHDGLTIYFSALRSGGTGTHDIWYSTRANLGAAFSDVQLLGGVNSSTYNDHCTAMSADGLELYVSQTLAGSDIDIFVATRADTQSAFDTPIRVAELSFPGEDHPGWLSRDRLRFYYSNQSAGGSAQIYLATRTCD
ncbi:MAG TPA: hypothetical protein VIV11_23775 [Kofleriaceae bacterium]